MPKLKNTLNVFTSPCNGSPKTLGYVIGEYRIGNTDSPGLVGKV